MITNNDNEVSFIVDSKGNKTHAIVSIEIYKELQNLKSMFAEDFDINNHETFFFCVKGISASGFPIGKRSSPSFMLSKGSMISAKYAQSLREPVIETRKHLINNNQLEFNDKHNCYILKESYLLSSPSFAASLVAGNNRNGLDAWETKDGYSLKDSGYGPHADES
ncbi:MAG: DUF4357 domain-containing protein [Succinivibrionaceae bacterium]